MNTCSSRESPFSPFWPGCPWETEAKIQSNSLLQSIRLYFIIQWSLSETYCKTRSAFVAMLSWMPWFSVCPVAAVCPWFPPGSTLSGVALQSKHQIKRCHTCSVDVQWASTASSHPHEWTYRNSITSRESRNAGHSLLGINNTTH